jgi:hypothetical protein
VDFDFDGSFDRGRALLGLDCPRCGRDLDASEVAATDIDTEDPREPNIDDDRYGDS